MIALLRRWLAPRWFEYRGQWRLDGITVIQAGPTMFFIGPTSPDIETADFEARAKAFVDALPRRWTYVLFHGPISFEERT